MHTDPTDTTAVARPSGPVDRDISCPLCEYNLRALTEPRCPECGFRFTWDELNDKAKWRHPFVFEHHPECNTRSFVRTALAGLRPKRFWQSLSPVQRPSVRRLILYWAICAAAYTIPLSFEVGRAIWFWGRGLAAQRAWDSANWKNPKMVAPQYSERILRDHGSLQAYLDANLPVSPFGVIWNYVWHFGVVLVAQILPIFLPWIIALSLSLFQWSMMRIGIRPQHVLRCAIYSCDALLWIAAIAMLVLVVERLIPMPPLPIGTLTNATLAVLPILLLTVIASYRLVISYRVYMRFDRPVLTIVACQTIVLFIVVNLLAAAALPLLQ